MPPPVPTGMRYAGREEAVIEPRPHPPSMEREAPPGPLGRAPGAFPEASGTALTPPGLLYPSAGPTEFGYLYGQMQGAVFPGQSNVFTAPQTFTAVSPSVTAGVITLKITDAGGGGDSDALRPAILVMEHDTTAVTAPGVGMGQLYQIKDDAGSVVITGREVNEITYPAAGLVESTTAWTLRHQGIECEVFRIRGQTGMAATSLGPGGSVANGYVGGQLFCRADFYHAGNAFGIFSTTPVTKQTVAAAATDPASTQTLANSLRSLLIAYGFA